MAKKKKKRASSRKKTALRRGKMRNGGKLPKEAVTLAVILRPRDGQDLMLEAELRALIAPTRKEEVCIVLLRGLARFCCMKSGRRASTTPRIQRPTIFCAGMRGRMDCWLRAKWDFGGRLYRQGGQSRNTSALTQYPRVPTL
jgi:hypothetical protein